jgi:hypothetical protein
MATTIFRTTVQGAHRSTPQGGPQPGARRSIIRGASASRNSGLAADAAAAARQVAESDSDDGAGSSMLP